MSAKPFLKQSSCSMAATIMLVSSLWACTGKIANENRPTERPPGGEPGEGTGGSTPSDDNTGGNDPPKVESVPPGQRPLRRLTRFELRNTLGDLLGAVPEVPAALPEDVLSSSGFIESGNISKVETEILVDWMGKLAVTAAATLEKISACPTIPAARPEQDQCAERFIAQFGRRAFRRPLTPTETGEFFAYYKDVLRSELGYDFRESIRGLIQIVLLSPRFLYHWERPPGAATVQEGRIALGPHEVASRLSYLLWGTMPDQALMQAADSDQLATPDEIAIHARRLLADQRSRVLLENFFLQWLGIGDISRKTKAARYGYSPELGTAMLAESRRFVSWVLDNDASLETMLTSPVAFIDNAKLATLYGYTGAVGTAAKEVVLDNRQRAGLLTRAAFLTAQSLDSELNPIKRGVTVVEKLLCLHIPAPPADAGSAKPADPNLPTRERLQEHASKSACRGCHAVFDPFGFAFEHYDGIGAYRSMDGGRPVNTSATVQFADGGLPVKDALELSGLLAKSPEVHECLAQHMLRNTLRRPEAPGDADSLRALRATSTSPDNLRELMVSLVTSAVFQYREPSPGEEIL